MRELIKQLLSENGVSGVQGVPETSKSAEKHDLKGSCAGTHFTGSLEHSEHIGEKGVSCEKGCEINGGTHITLGTPDFEEMYEERAAIMEFDAGMTRDKAEAAAFADCQRIRGEYGPKD